MNFPFPDLKNRNFGLDVIRACSILLVLIAHTIPFQNLELGVVGVEMFFVLSGFLIGQILLRDFSDGVNFDKITHFWKRRWFRTLPLYYAILLAKFFLIDPSIGKNVLVYFFFLQNNFYGIQYFEVSWSLVIEEWFYLFTPLIFLVLFRNGIDRRKLLWLFLAGIVLALISRIAWVAHTNVSFGGIRGNFPFRYDSLIFGLLLAHLKLNYTQIYSRLNSRWAILPAIGFIVALTWLLGNISRPDATSNTALWTRSLWFSLMSFSIFLTIPFLENSRFMNAAGKLKLPFYFFTWISLITYSVYLTHTFTIDAVKHLIYNLYLPEYLQVSIEYLFVLFISSVIFLFLEYPATQLREIRFKV